MPDRSPQPSGKLILYQSDDGLTRLDVRLENESVWLSQAQMAELFQTTKQNVSLHIRNLFLEGELPRAATVKESLTVQLEGKRSVARRIELYNLDVIISVGYRVKSHRGTQFRIWATQRLREYIVKGFTLDDERLKQAGGGSYFDELLARIRDIRSSEKLDFAELQAHGRRPMHMRDWIAKLDDFLRLSERELLTHAGYVSHEVARRHAEVEYDKWRQQALNAPSQVEKDFEAAVEKIKKLGPPKRKG